MTKHLAIGIDIGGSHISCCLFDLLENKLLKESFITEKVNNIACADEILHVWANTISKLSGTINTASLAGIGFAMPGPFDYTNGIARFTNEVDKYWNLFNIPVNARLADLLHLDKNQFRFINDASAFAIGEARTGKSRNTSRSLAITLGTGFGSAFIADKLPVVHGNRVPEMGCLWHLPFKNGIGDDYFSTRWICQRYKEMTGIELPGVKEIIENSSKDITSDLFKLFGENLGEFISPWLQKFNAEMLVIGGNISGAYPLFGEALKRSFNKKNTIIKVETSELMEHAAIVGSAALFDNNYWQRIKTLLGYM